MKCPKCGYNSFEYHSSCKKCSADLAAHKQTYSITPIALPPEAKEKKADDFRIASSQNEPPAESVETHEDMFSFDLPGAAAPSSSSAASKSDDPFNFDDDLPEVVPPQVKADEEAFTDLFESTSQVVDDSPVSSFNDSFDAPTESTAQNSGPSEFDLENFSWDDTPVTPAKSGVQTGADDFDSLFGDTSSGTKK
jgi:predicted  nucleic acid-binding Zn-ribbon protein